MESPQPQRGEGCPALESEFRYVDAAPYDEVMMEQLEYLLMHCGSGRHARCSDCVRLETISRYLLAPFR